MKCMFTEIISETLLPINGGRIGYIIIGIVTIRSLDLGA